MRQINLLFKIEESAYPDQLDRYHEIIQVLLDKGALDGVKNGKAIIHFDSQGVFQGVELDYWPWKRRARKDG